MLLLSRLLAASTVIASAYASPVSNIYNVHEKRESLPEGWSKRELLDRRALIPLRFALAQNNLDKGAEWLDDVSHPSSEKFGKHWSAKEVAEAFAPSGETIDAVREWLHSAGISSERVKLSQGMNWLEVHASVDEAENLLKTEYNVYEHGETGQPHVACEEYSVPAHLQKHIDFVYPTVHFDAKLKARSEDFEKKKRVISPGTDKSVGLPGSGSLPKIPTGSLPKNPFGFNWFQNLKDCDKFITPDCLRALYLFPKGISANPRNSFGIVEYTPQAYVPSDLDMFFKNFSKSQIGERPILNSIDGGVVQQTNMSFDFNGESDLDLEYAMTLVHPQKVTLYQVGDLVEGASFNDFLDGIDASYCTYDGGDDPNQDATYPDPYGTAPLAYEGPKNCGGFSATKVISTSYGYNEHDLTPFYENRQCHEYMKLGLMGVSVVYSSGDYGVAGNQGQCINGTGADAPYTPVKGTFGRFNPAFPSTCPYVTSVGATQVINGTFIPDAIISRTEPEMACETVIYSGGGFSNVFPIPNYQKSAVKSWFKNYPPPYGADRFNNSQMTRGYPDISANGANYVVAVDGTFSLVFGTSASAPTFGSILTLINEARYDLGKSSIGFINPVAYAHPYIWNDVTQGGNQGCGTAGFSSSPGWDPVTGLGTPNFPKLLALYLSLP
ncbi:Hypothetical protein R9X50_00077200 [Acrodontium crateriforme]|uniref:tripeptidyl-peptidase II n=1 Tax=Acrodontium crateriforme TaxID=150365 RepID=A0AAQ3R7H7_9PEZI|nr:Hypothetical protein R9X50_00077200 [Acrodontium crateriforme]